MIKIPYSHDPIKLHLSLAGVWVALMLPTVLFWAESVLWVGLMSCYALFIGHISSYEAAKTAGVDAKTRIQLTEILEVVKDLKRQEGKNEE